MNIEQNTRLDAFNEFQGMVDSVFGKGAITVQRTNHGNNVINTWCHANDFSEFKQNFCERLKRLNEIYKDKRNRDVIFNLVAHIGSENNWEGSYAELVAYDVIHTEYNLECHLDVTKQANFALAEKLGKREVNYDIHFDEDFSVYMDVKAFTDTVGDILNHSVISSVLRMPDFSGKGIGIQPEYPFDDNDEDYKANVQPLTKELVDALHKLLDSGKKQVSYTSMVLPRLSFNILIGSGVISTMSGYNPYRRAEQLKDIVIKRYCNKLPYIEPFFLVFVNFPWFNQRDTNAFGDTNKALYRSLARRTFMQYTHSDEFVRNINHKYTGEEPAMFATKKLSGMIFIDDLSIKEAAQDIYIYFNPNAENKRNLMSTYFDMLSRKGEDGDIDDFRYDNY